MIQKLIEKLNKKRLKERISSAIVMVALIVSISGVVGAVSGIIVSNRYNYALKNYGFSQGDIGKMMITFADTRSYLRAAIGYQDENLVNSCAENYEKKKESCQQYTKEVKNTVSRQLVARLSSARDNLLFKPYQNGSKTPENQGFPGFYCI
jgi:methyl-accepting chemotaxis protein